MIRVSDLIAIAVYSVLYMEVVNNKSMSTTGKHFWVAALVAVLLWYLWRL